MVTKLAYLLQRYKPSIVVNFLAHVDKSSLKDSKIGQSWLFSTIVFCLIDEHFRIVESVSSFQPAETLAELELGDGALVSLS